MDFHDFFLAARLTKQVSREALGQWTRKAKERLRRESRMLEMVEQLRLSWRGQCDPGKGSPYVFLVRDYRIGQKGPCGVPILWCDPFFARELVDNLEDAERGVAEWFPSTKRVPVPLGGLDEAVRETCTECGAEDALVVGIHAQAYDSPHGDTWFLRLFRACPHCCLVEQIALMTGEYRMNYLLRRPEVA